MLNIIYALLIIVAIVALYDGIKARKSTRKASRFFLLDGKLKVPNLVGTIVSSNLSLGNMIFVCAIWGYFYGFSGVFWVAICIITLTVSYIFFAKYFKDYIEDRSNSGTLHEFISLGFYGNPKMVRLTASAVTILCILFALVLELDLASKLANQVLGVSNSTSFIVLTGIIAVYSGLGGFRTVVFTDFMQTILLLSGIIAGVLFAISGDIGSGIWPTTTASEVLGGVGWHNAVGIVVIGFGWLLITMDTWQRNCSTRNLPSTKTGTWISGGIMTISVILFGLAGMYTKYSVEPYVESNGLELILSGGFYPINDLFTVSSEVSSFSVV